jgi:hypothetical protein
MIDFSLDRVSPVFVARRTPEITFGRSRYWALAVAHCAAFNDEERPSVAHASQRFVRRNRATVDEDSNGRRIECARELERRPGLAASFIAFHQDEVRVVRF